MGDASGTADPRVRPGAEDGVYYVQNAESGQTETWKVGARYRLLSVLGCGSYGAVCKAADVHARRLVALKRVPDALNTLESAKRVLREVVVLNRLDHPNIIKVFDMFYTPATSGARRMNPETFSLVPVSIDLYMAFEIADGGDLFELRGEMSAAEVRSLMRQLAGAVKYLHDVGVWHRDIKSANTLCGRNRAGGRVAKICDFGLARGAASANDTDRETRGDDKSDADERMATGEEDEFRARRPKKHRRSFSGSSRGSFGSGGVLASGSRSVVGFARVTSFARADMLTSVVATPCYRAPEVIMSDGGYTGAIDVWALGCIFGELLQRQQQHALTPHLTVSPLFRFDDDPVSEPDSGETYTKWMSNGVANGDGDGDGDGDVDMRDATSRRERRVKARLNLFFDVVGTPSWRDVRAVSSERWRAYLRGIRGRPGSLTRQFAGCDDASRDLLLRMLTFDSGRRATPDEILAHEYFLADEGAHRSAEQGADQSLDATVGSDLASMDADARLWEMDQPGAALAALETEFAAAAAARDGVRAGGGDCGAWREGFEELFRRECDRSTRSGAKDESPPPPASPTSFARWESAFDHPSGEDVSARSTLVELRDLPGRFHDVFPLFFRGAQRPLAYDGGDPSAFAPNAREDRVDIESRYLGGAPGTTGVYGQGGVGVSERHFGRLGDLGLRRGELSFGEWGTGDAAAARMNEDEMGDRLGALGHLGENRHGEWGELDLPTAQKRGVTFGGEEVMGASGAWGVTAVPPGMSKQEGDLYLSVSNQQGR